MGGFDSVSSGNRNRADGWKYAKASGHENEILLVQCLKSPEGMSALAQRVGVSAPGGSVEMAHAGKSEVGVPSILGDTTKSKADVRVSWSGVESTSQISVKKSEGGQVFLITVERFLEGFGRHFSAVPPDVARGLSLFIGGSDESDEALNNVTPYDSRIRAMETRYQSRMVWETLQRFDKRIARALLEWLTDSIGEICEFCFSRGLAADHQDWADFLWYRNLVDPDSQDLDSVVAVDDLKLAVANNGGLVAPGSRNGGSTIHMPFGWLQYHQGQIQFHHKLGSISAITPIR